MTYEHGQSDDVVVPKKSANKAGLHSTAAEQMEGSTPTKGNEKQRNTLQTQRWESVRSELQLVHQLAKEDKKKRFTALLHHIYNVDALRNAYFKIKKDASAGVDSETWTSYGENLEENIQELSERLKRGAYRAKPVKRVYIPKADGRQRPLGVTTLEDKIVQRATVEVLDAIYEADFLGYSYGFRPGRNQHQALDALTAGLTMKKVNWVLDADIRDFFGSISHEWLIKFIEHRIADKRIVRLIQKWLNAGVLEDGKIWHEEQGAPQGASASPLLANVYLHYVYDLWVQQWRQKHARGEVIVVRFADDTIVGFQHRSDADQFLIALKERLRKFDLELHPKKTRLIEFGRYANKRRKERGMGKPDTFTFLGFTHICGQTPNGKFMVIRHTIKKKMQAKLKELKSELKQRMHDPIKEVGKWLGKVVTGHYQYYGVPGNSTALYLFRFQVYCYWRDALKRRSQKGYITWKRMKTIADHWLPKPRICHPYPLERFAVRTQGKSPVR